MAAGSGETEGAGGGGPEAPLTPHICAPWRGAACPHAPASCSRECLPRPCPWSPGRSCTSLTKLPPSFTVKGMPSMAPGSWSSWRPMTSACSTPPPRLTSSRPGACAAEQVRAPGQWPSCLGLCTCGPGNVGAAPSWGLSSAPPAGPTSRQASGPCWSALLRLPAVIHRPSSSPALP